MPQAFRARQRLLSFLLMNIEIADFFAPSGQATLIFEFGGHFWERCDVFTELVTLCIGDDGLRSSLSYQRVSMGRPGAPFP